MLVGSLGCRYGCGFSSPSRDRWANGAGIGPQGLVRVNGLERNTGEKKANEVGKTPKLDRKICCIL